MCLLRARVAREKKERDERDRRESTVGVEEGGMEVDGVVPDQRRRAGWWATVQPSPPPL
jgi:hypothetical protein